jgi:hypothetical protein
MDRSRGAATVIRMTGLGSMAVKLKHVHALKRLGRAPFPSA